MYSATIVHRLKLAENAASEFRAYAKERALNKKKLGVTGMSVLYHSYLIDTLEGELETIQAILEARRKESGADNLHVLALHPIDKRMFAAWKTSIVDDNLTDKVVAKSAAGLADLAKASGNCGFSDALELLITP